MTDHDIPPSGTSGDPVSADVLVSRPDIARLAGVKRPAVTNWERRYPEYPAPVGGDPELFRSGEVLAWLSTRTIPTNALLPNEPTGTTYGDRFRAGLPGGTAGGLLRLVERLAGPGGDRLRGGMPQDDYLWWLLYFVDEHIKDPAEGMAEQLRRYAMLGPEQHSAKRVFPPGALTELFDTLGRTPVGSEQEARAAFDHVLVRWRAEHARSDGGAFLTPPSVSRVMAGALAAVRPGAVRVHDPYARVGELLAAYLDAVVVQGDEQCLIYGRAPGLRERLAANWNLRVHHGQVALLAEGPVTPVLDPEVPPGFPETFDVLLTNPPFGRLLEDVVPPPYWTYGPARRTEFDWLQYAVSRLTSDGRAAVLMPAGAAFNAGAAEKVRSGLVEAGAVECVIALPAGLFTLTAVKTHIWFLRAPGHGGTPDSAPEVLFVAGEHLGRHVTRTQQALSDDDIARLVGEYVSWHEARQDGAPFAGTPGLSRSVPVLDIVARGHSLDPVSWIRPTGPAWVTEEAGSAGFRNRLHQLTEEIGALHTRAREADAEAARWLRRYGL